MKRVLVIGSNSYIGGKFKQYVLQMVNAEIIIDLVGALDGSWRTAELTTYDVVLHLAAIVHIKESEDLEALYYAINHDLALEVAEKAKENHVKQFIFMSTASIFGLGTGCITKDTIPNPKTLYGKSKLLAEIDIMKLKNEEFQIAIVRPPMVYGKGCKGNYAKLVKLAKFTPLFPGYHNKRSMLQIDILSEYLVNLIRNECSGYFHPQNEDYVDTCKMIEEIRKEIGRRTILFTNMNGIISYLVKKNLSVFQRMFGDLYYDKELL